MENPHDKPPMLDYARANVNPKAKPSFIEGLIYLAGFLVTAVLAMLFVGATVSVLLFGSVDFVMGAALLFLGIFFSCLAMIGLRQAIRSWRS